MKKFIPLFVFVLLAQLVSAQYCGHTGTPSGSSQCSPSGLLTKPGFAPTADSLPSMVNGTTSSTIIQFKNFDTITFAGSTLKIQSLRVDSIGNLPAGTCWTINKSNNTWGNQEDGCIRISGTTCSTPGQYRLKIKITAYVGASPPGAPISTDASAAGLYYYLRVKNAGAADVPIDTTGQAAGQSSTAFKPYGPQANCGGTSIVVNLGSNQTVCSGANVTLTPSITGGTQPYTYSWNTSGNSLSCNNCQNPTATITQTSTYTVTVTDNNSNTATASITYTVASSNYQITANSATTFCQGGSVTLNAGSGYASYHWSNNSSSSTISASQTGTYSVTVTTSLGCTLTNSISVTVNTPTISNYQITANGPTSFCSGGSVTLNGGAGFNSYHWSNNSTSQTISVSQTGTYAVTAVGTDGCTYTDNQAVNTNTSFSGQAICIVSVDQSSGKNVIVWEKSSGFGIDSFKVYKETTIANQYQLIRQQAFGNFSTYEDGQSNPQQISNKYVITTVDACGESQYSTAHKTIHLTSNVGINNEVNLIWNAYEGISYPSFNIYRGSNQSNLTQLTQVSAGTLSYTDITPPSPPLYYQIEVINPQGCVPTAKTESYGSSLSNIVQITPQGLNDLDEADVKIYSFYDETTGENIVKWSAVNTSIQVITVYDMSGRKVYINSNTATQEIRLPKQISFGIYVAELSFKDKTFCKKIVVK